MLNNQYHITDEDSPFEILMTFTSSLVSSYTRLHDKNTGAAISRCLEGQARHSGYEYAFLSEVVNYLSGLWQHIPVTQNDATVFIHDA